MQFHHKLEQQIYPVLIAGGLVQLLFDTFTDTVGTELSAHIPDVDPGLGAYEELSGDHEIVAGNRLGVNVTAGVFLKNIGVSIGYAQIDVVDAGSNNPALIFNGIDIDNFWMLQARDIDNDVRLLENTTAGGLIVRATAAYVWALSITLRLERVAGDIINGYVDDLNTPILTFTSSLHNTATRVGMRTNVNNQEFDNLEARG